MEATDWEVAWENSQHFAMVSPWNNIWEMSASD